MPEIHRLAGLSHKEPGMWPCPDVVRRFEETEGYRIAARLSELEPIPMETVMRLLPIALTVFLFAPTVGFADSGESSLPTLGFYIIGETGADVLDTVIPELARMGFAESLPREMSTEHLPMASFQRSNGDQIRVIAGQRCALVTFSAAIVPSGADVKTYGRAYGNRVSTVHASLKQYFAQLPPPHPRILEGEIPPVGMCPREFQ
jgi:hypothetical protein